MDFTSVDTYIQKMHFTDLYDALDQPHKESIVFEATELLNDNFRESLLTDRIVALQTLYMLEGEHEDYDMFKRHGITQLNVKDISVTFKGRNGVSAGYDSISPDVLALIGKGRASVGELL